MTFLERSLTYMLGCLVPALINRLTALEGAQEKTQMDLTKLNDSVKRLQDTVTTGMGAIKADVKRLSDKIGAGETVSQAELDAIADQLDGVSAAVSQTMTDVDTSADTATGTQDDAPAEAPVAESDPAAEAPHSNS